MQVNSDFPWWNILGDAVFTVRPKIISIRSGQARELQCRGFILISPTGARFAVSAFVDPGSVSNVIHSSLVAKHCLPVTRLEKSLSISSISREVLAGSIQYHTLVRVMV